MAVLLCIIKFVYKYLEIFGQVDVILEFDYDFSYAKGNILQMILHFIIIIEENILKFNCFHLAFDP